jgi:hypothetical protein
MVVPQDKEFQDKDFLGAPALVKLTLMDYMGEVVVQVNAAKY